jgi:hypothetical protein
MTFWSKVMDSTPPPPPPRRYPSVEIELASACPTPTYVARLALAQDNSCPASRKLSGRVLTQDPGVSCIPWSTRSVAVLVHFGPSVAAGAPACEAVSDVLLRKSRHALAHCVILQQQQQQHQQHQQQQTGQHGLVILGRGVLRLVVSVTRAFSPTC